MVICIFSFQSLNFLHPLEEEFWQIRIVSVILSFGLFRNEEDCFMETSFYVPHLKGSYY